MRRQSEWSTRKCQYYQNERVEENTKIISNREAKEKREIFLDEPIYSRTYLLTESYETLKKTSSNNVPTRPLYNWQKQRTEE